MGCGWTGLGVRTEAVLASQWRRRREARGWESGRWGMEPPSQRMEWIRSGPRRVDATGTQPTLYLACRAISDSATGVREGGDCQWASGSGVERMQSFVSAFVCSPVF